MAIEQSVSFGEFEAYLAHLSEDASATAGLPTSEDEFEVWWQRISVSVELRDRWTRRIRLGKRFLNEIASEIEAMKRAA